MGARRVRAACVWDATGGNPEPRRRHHQAPIGSPLEAPGPWGKVVVQIPSRAGVEIESIWAEAKLVAINAAAKKWPGIVRLQDSGKLVLEDCNWDADALREPFYEDSLGRAWIIDPDQGSHEDR